MLPDRTRIFNKYVTNRLLRGFVHLSHGPFAIIRHIGRQSGKLSSSHQKQESTSDSSPWF